MPEQKFAHHYSEWSFWHKLKKSGGDIGKELLEKALWLYYVAQDPTVPVSVKALLYAALGYLVSPLDAIPDTIPVIGYSDDLAVLAAAVASVMMYITPEIKCKAQERLAIWFD